MGVFGWFCGVWGFFKHIYVFSIFDPDSFHTVFLEKLETIQEIGGNAMVYQKIPGVSPSELFIRSRKVFETLLLEVALNKAMPVFCFKFEN